MVTSCGLAEETRSVQILRIAFTREIDHAIGRRQDRLRRAIVAVERDDVSRRAELPREIQNVAYGGGAKRIDRLRVIADNGEARPVGLQSHQDRRLQAISVLIFVHEHVIEATADIASQ